MIAMSAQVIHGAPSRLSLVRPCESQEARSRSTEMRRVPTGDFTDRESAILDALMSTFAPPSADLGVAGAALRTTLLRLAPHRLAKIRGLLGLLDGPLLPFAMSGRFGSF